MRRIVITIAVVVAVIVAGVAIFVARFDVNRYRGRIQSELQSRLGRPAQLGDMHLKLFPFGIRVQNLAIADDPRFSPDTPFVKAGELDVSVKLLPLLRKQVELRSLNLQRPTVNLIRNQARQWNFASIGHPAETSAQSDNPPNAKRTQPQPSNAPSQSSQQHFSLGDLVIKDGQISLLDQTQDNTPTLYDHIDATLKDFSPNSSFTLDAAIHLAGSGAQGITL